MSEKVRVRYAPSPTGYIHIGNLRTALYNYLFARHNGGDFIVRIEDTDRTRYVPGAVENLINTLDWVGLDYDEGPVKGGKYEPYYQSERLAIYKDYADYLIKNKKAYYCFCTSERLTQLREEQNKTTKDTRYDKLCLHLSEEDIQKNLAEGKQYVIRLNVEPGLKIAFKDIIRGDVEFSSDVIDDQVLIKSDGFPTYHLANIIDDHLMEISHVIRGEEWLPSVPKHILLYEAFGWQHPQFAHLPLLLNPDRSKLSKRQGDVAVEDYQKKGYLKEALINFIALLGWTAGDNKEIYTFDELIKSFSLERVNDSGAVFDIEKLNWLNEEHLRSKSDSELINMLRGELYYSKYSSYNYTNDYLQKVIEAMKPRVSFIRELYEKGFYFFEEPETYEETAVKKNWKPNSADILKKYSEKISLLVPSGKDGNLKKEDYEKALVETSTEMNVGKGAIIHPLRLAVSGVSGGPGIYDILYIIGKEKVRERVDNIIYKIM
jgi:glutamyl-tRNA synthetase